MKREEGACCNGVDDGQNEIFDVKLPLKKLLSEKEILKRCNFIRVSGVSSRNQKANVFSEGLTKWLHGCASSNNSKPDSDFADQQQTRQNFIRTFWYDGRSETRGKGDLNKTNNEIASNQEDSLPELALLVNKLIEAITYNFALQF